MAPTAQPAEILDDVVARTRDELARLRMHPHPDTGGLALLMDAVLQARPACHREDLWEAIASFREVLQLTRALLARA